MRFYEQSKQFEGFHSNEKVTTKKHWFRR